MKRILVISPFVPYPPDRGHRVRTYYLLRQLCSRFDIALVTQCFDRHEEQMAQALAHDLRALDTLVAVRAPTHRSVLHRSSAAVVSRIFELLGWPRERYYHASALLRSRVAEIMDRFRPDLVQVQYWFTAHAVPSRRTVPVWIDSMDIHSRREHSIAAMKSASSLRKWYRFRTALVERHEFAAYQAARRVIAVHDIEQQILLQRLGSDCVFTIPITLHVPSNPLERLPGRVVAFLGAMDYAPNRDAVGFLITAIMPRVRQAIPDCRLRIVGGGAEQWRRVFPQGWVDWPGHVPSLERALHDVSVAVAPMRAGAGTNVKVLSLLSLGLPTVATNRAVEGLALASGEHLFIRDDAAGIADGIVALLSDQNLAMRLGSRGHDAVLRHYHWETSCRHVCDLYERELAS